MITLKQLIKNRFMDILIDFSKSAQSMMKNTDGIEEFEFYSFDKIKEFVDEIMEGE